LSQEIADINNLPSNTNAWSPIQDLLNQTNLNIMYFQRVYKTESAKTLALITLTNSPAPFYASRSSLMDGGLHFSNVASLLMRKDGRHPHDSTFLNKPHNWRFMILFGWGLSGSRTT